jgi:hypothetical protein
VSPPVAVNVREKNNAEFAAYQRELRAKRKQKELAALSEELGRPATEKDLLFRKHSKLDAMPFRSYLAGKCQEIGYANVSSAVGWDARRVYTFVSGWYEKNSKRYEVKFVQLNTVDHVCSSLGDHWGMIYPNEYQEDTCT